MILSKSWICDLILKSLFFFFASGHIQIFPFLEQPHRPWSQSLLAGQTGAPGAFTPAMSGGSVCTWASLQISFRVFTTTKHELKMLVAMAVPPPAFLKRKTARGSSPRHFLNFFKGNCHKRKLAVHAERHLGSLVRVKKTKQQQQVRFIPDWQTLRCQNKCPGLA